MAGPTTIDTSAATEGFKILGDVVNSLTDEYANLAEKWKETITVLGETTTISSQATTQIGLLTAGLNKSQNAFSGLGRETHGFSSQLNDLGISLPKNVQNIISAADGGLRLQNTFITLSAATGNLGKVFEDAGQNLENINSVLDKQIQMMNATQIATGLSANEVETYYKALGEIPGGLNAVINVQTKAGSSMNMLTAAVKYATGSGRSFTDVMSDLKNAFQDYGLTGENALKFSARMGEVANNLGIDLSSVQNHLTQTADAFKMFADGAAGGIKMTEGLAAITNQYVQALKDTGLSGNSALGVVRGLTDAIGSLQMGQKAFLSAQTGGPGGLMGAFQIEKLMREGNIQEVLNKFRTQMRSQMGRAVSLEEATQDPAMAAQRMRQIALLRQGPLGSIAKDDVTAGRILDSFKAMDEGKTSAKDLKEDILSSTMDKGTAIAEKSYTELTKIRSIIEGQQRVGAMASYRTLQSGFTIGAGDNLANEPPSVTAYRDRQRQYMSGGLAYGVNPNMNPGQMTIENGKQFFNTIKSIPDDVKASFRGMKNAILGGDVEGIELRKKRFENDIKSRKADKNFAMDKESQQIVAQEEFLIKQGKAYLSNKNQYGAYNPYAGMQYATDQSVGNVPEEQKARQQFKPINGQVHVHVTGYCLKCKREVEDNPQLRTINVSTE